jgi:hypothetical protein
MGMAEIEAFLTHLVVEGDVAASMQNQALNTLLFLYRKVLSRDLEDQKVDSVRARKKNQVACGVEQRRSATGDFRYVRAASSDDKAALWQWLALDGVYSLAGARLGFWHEGVDRARRQGWQRPHYAFS